MLFSTKVLVRQTQKQVPRGVRSVNDQSSVFCVQHLRKPVRAARVTKADDTIMFRLLCIQATADGHYVT